MIKEIGKVIDIEHDQSGDWLLVETAIKSTCSSCAAKSNCGTSTIAQAFSRKSVVNRVKNQLSANIGDTVEIGISEASLLHGSFLIYILPLVTAMLLAFVAQFSLANIIEITEPTLIFITLLGGGLGFKIANRQINKKNNEELMAKLIAILPAAIEITELKPE